MFRGVTNKLITTGLFYEPTVPKHKQSDNVLYSLQSSPFLPKGWEHLISAKDTYILLNDVTGVDWANAYLEGYSHFERLLKMSWFKEAIDSWNRELAQKARSEALKAIRVLSTDETTSASVRVSAAKYMAEEGWKKGQTRSSVGRPSKVAVAKEVKEAARKLTAVESDAERIGLKVVGGTSTGT